jgi:hypothetical protein
VTAFLQRARAIVGVMLFGFTFIRHGNGPKQFTHIVAVYFAAPVSSIVTTVHDGCGIARLTHSESRANTVHTSD